MKPLHVLVVSPIASHPVTQGNSARIVALAEELKRRNVIVDFFYYGMEGLSSEQSDMMKAFWNQFVFMKSLSLKKPSLSRTWGLDDWVPDELCIQVAAVCAKRRYHAVIVNYVWMSKVLEGIAGPVKVIDTHDLFGDRHKVAGQTGLEPRWFFTTLEEESRGFRRADVVVGIQKKESAHIRTQHGGLTCTVGHPIQPRFLMQPETRKPFFSFGYLGSGNPFNVKSIMSLDAALCHSSIPVWALAGSISNRKLVLRSSPARLGMVDTLADFYDNVECVLNPMLGGTGLKIKTIEALAFGKSIIGTCDAFEGLDPVHPYHTLVDIADMAKAMEAYVSSPSLRDELRHESLRLYSRYMAEVSDQYNNLVAVMRGTDAMPSTRDAA